MVLPSLLAAAGSFLVLEAAARRVAAARWVNRGIRGIPVSWRVSFASVCAAVAGVAVAGWWGWRLGVSAAVAAAAAAWLVTVVWRTDLASRKIPAGACWATFFTSLAAAFISRPEAGAVVEFSLALLIVGALLVAVLVFPRRGLGGGDARLLIALTPLSVFTSATVFAVGIVAAVAGQLVYRRARHIPHGDPQPFGPALGSGVLAISTAAVFVG